MQEECLVRDVEGITFINGVDHFCSVGDNSPVKCLCFHRRVFQVQCFGSSDYGCGPVWLIKASPREGV